MPAEFAHKNALNLGHIISNGRQVDVYAIDPELPSGTEDREECMSHILDNRIGSELLYQFWLSGCHIPEDEDNPKINFQLACKGLSRIRHKCRLTLTQFDDSGKVITKGKITG